MESSQKLGRPRRKKAKFSKKKNQLTFIVNFARNGNSITHFDFDLGSAGIDKNWRRYWSEIPPIDGVYMVIRRTWNMTREMDVIYLG